MGSVLQNELFQVQEGPFMSNTLSNLNQRFPRALTEFCLTFDTLLIPHNEDNSERLLQNRSLLYFLLDCQSNFKSHGVGLRPDPSSINQSDLLSTSLGGLQTTDVCKTERHEFSTFQLTSDPFTSLFMPSLTTSALMQRDFRADASSDIGRAGQTRCTSIGCIRSNGNSTDAAKNLNVVASVVCCCRTADCVRTFHCGCLVGRMNLKYVVALACESSMY
jgi:hypothetical protein